MIRDFAFVLTPSSFNVRKVTVSTGVHSWCSSSCDQGRRCGVVEKAGREGVNWITWLEWIQGTQCFIIRSQLSFVTFGASVQHFATLCNVSSKENPTDPTAVFAINAKPVALSIFDNPELQTHHCCSVIHYCFDSCCAWDPHSGCCVSQANPGHLQWPGEGVARETRQVVAPPNSLIKRKHRTPDYFHRAEWQCENQRG